MDMDHVGIGEEPTTTELSSWSVAEPILGAWYRRARESQFAHYVAANRYSRTSKLLGIPSVVLAAAAGSTLLATLNGSASMELRLVAGFVALLAAVLSALQTFLGLADLSEQHRRTASRYGAIRRQIEQYQATLPIKGMTLSTTMGNLRGCLDDAAEAAPDVPAWAWKKSQSHIEHTERPEGFRR